MQGSLIEQKQRFEFGASTSVIDNDHSVKRADFLGGVRDGGETKLKQK